MTITTATGRRKQAVARIRLTPGTGQVTANGRAFEDYFPSAVHRTLITEPLRVTGSEDAYDISVSLHGGGLSGQAGAFRLGIARALIEINPDDRPGVKAAGLLTRDPRKKESKKYGLKKARKAPQYSKR
ncbi:MAG: 30S ribosomal protein S9 [Acidimicrobiales bacterium]|nr:30S ribosomal protein S9 [Acidimicrobiales bacterium]